MPQPTGRAFPYLRGSAPVASQGYAQRASTRIVHQLPFLSSAPARARATTPGLRPKRTAGLHTIVAALLSGAAAVTPLRRASPAALRLRSSCSVPPFSWRWLLATLIELHTTLL